MKKEEFKPFIPAEKILPEITPVSIILGVLLAVVFGGANAYLGLRVGTTVSASIPAAVISMAIMRIVLKRDSILENNMVQTIGSAGESIAGGAIFTLPALFLWASEGTIESPSLITITIIALCGGFLGVIFMIPLRNSLIVQEHGTLPYPEGTACAEVLLAGEDDSSSSTSIFKGLGISALIKFVVDGLKITGSSITIPVKQLFTEFTVQVYPALIGVGYIIGPKIASYNFAGALIGWFVLIPAIVTFGGDTVLYPGTETIAKMYAEGGPSAIWSNYLRYIGAGAVTCGGIISLIKSLPTIISTFAESMKNLKNGSGEKIEANRTNQNLNGKFLIVLLIAIVLVLWLIPAVPVNLVGAILIVVFGFFFATVSARMVGLVGSTNNPISGMTIATLLFTTFLLKSIGITGAEGMVGAMCIASVTCIVSALAGDTSQDLKTGYLLGASPVKQQIGELIGTFASALTIGGVLVLLDKAWGYGGTEIPAPQAMLMKMITESVMSEKLPWALIFMGICFSLVIHILGIPVLPVALGLYLPLELSATIMIGGILKGVIDRFSKAKDKDSEANTGILFCSGLIAGEGLIGILLAFFAVIGWDKKIDLSASFSSGIIGAIVVIAIIVAFIIKFGMEKSANEK